MPWGSCPCPGVEMRGSPPLAPPLCVCVEKSTLPYLRSPLEAPLVRFWTTRTISDDELIGYVVTIERSVCLARRPICSEAVVSWRASNMLCGVFRTRFAMDEDRLREQRDSAGR